MGRIDAKFAERLLGLNPQFRPIRNTICTKEKGKEIEQDPSQRNVKDGIYGFTPSTTTEFNRFLQVSTPLLPKQIRSFIEIC